MDVLAMFGIKSKQIYDMQVCKFLKIWLSFIVCIYYNNISKELKNRKYKLLSLIPSKCRLDHSKINKLLILRSIYTFLIHDLDLPSPLQVYY